MDGQTKRGRHEGGRERTRVSSDASSIIRKEKRKGEEKRKKKKGFDLI